MRILFANLFPSHGISGGIKKFYRCAELLTAAGWDAWVWQPEGVPSWLETTAQVLAEQEIRIDPEDVLVIPEAMDGQLAELMDDPRTSRKILFCQNQYYLLNPHVVGRRLEDLGFGAVLCPSHMCAGFISRVFHGGEIHVVPSLVDPQLFRPGPKRLQIACAPRKLRRELELVRNILVTKYPETVSIPWIGIHGAPEAEVARIMGESAIYFSTSHLESLGIMPLEAMSAGCTVVGFHGYGGLEYATPANGDWYHPDELEEAADALWETIEFHRSGGPALQARLREGFATAARFRPEATRQALLAAFGRLPWTAGPRVHRMGESGLESVADTSAS